MTPDWRDRTSRVVFRDAISKVATSPSDDVLFLTSPATTASKGPKRIAGQASALTIENIRSDRS